MAIRWPQYESKEPNNQTDPVGNAVKVMCDAAVAQSAANARELQQAKAEVARRQRQESLEAAKVLTFCSMVLKDKPKE